MNIFLTLLAILGVAIATYAWSEARRWRARAEELRFENTRILTETESQQQILDAMKDRAAAAEAAASREREVANVKVNLLTHTQQQLEERFRALAAETLQTNSQLFLDRSRQQVQGVIEPVSQTLRQFEEHIRSLEKERVGAYQGITTQIEQLLQVQERVRQSADDLKNALRSPHQRGRWGELQLRRAVELAGMLEYCDFAEQKTLFGETNQRPDLIVHLPNQCQVVVDAKVSLEAYLKAFETQNEAERLRYLADHARQVKTHIESLGRKAYWERLPGSPDFVVAFLPLESLLSAALDQDPAILELGMQSHVVIATPITLITLLRTVAHGWRQHSLGERAEKIRELGIELYTRVLTMSEHFAKLGDSISKTVNAYNSTVVSLERNVFSSARKLKELRPANARQIEQVGEIESSTRAPDPSKWIA